MVFLLNEELSASPIFFLGQLADGFAGRYENDVEIIFLEAG